VKTALAALLASVSCFAQAPIVIQPTDLLSTSRATINANFLSLYDQIAGGISSSPNQIIFNNAGTVTGNNDLTWTQGTQIGNVTGAWNVSGAFSAGGTSTFSALGAGIGHLSSGGVLSSSSVSLTADVSGTLPGANMAAVNLAAAGNGGVTGLLPHANIASTAVTPGSYTSANITIAADGSITAAANGSASSAITALTGDCSASGPGSVAVTCSQAAGGIGSFAVGSLIFGTSGYSLTSTSGGGPGGIDVNGAGLVLTSIGPSGYGISVYDVASLAGGVQSIVGNGNAGGFQNNSTTLSTLSVSNNAGSTWPALNVSGTSTLNGNVSLNTNSSLSLLTLTQSGTGPAMSFGNGVLASAGWNLWSPAAFPQRANLQASGVSKSPSIYMFPSVSGPGLGGNVIIWNGPDATLTNNTGVELTVGSSTAGMITVGAGIGSGNFITGLLIGESSTAGANLTNIAFEFNGVNKAEIVPTGFETLLGTMYQCTHGSNATCGVATLSSGTVTVSTTAINALAAAGAAGYAVNLVLQSCSSCGALSVGTVTNSTSFVINSTNGSDASKVYWEIRYVN